MEQINRVNELGTGLFGDYMVSRGLITSEALREGLKDQKTRPHLRIGELLVSLGFLSADDLLRSLQDYNVQLRVGELLMASGFITFLQMMQALEEQRVFGGRLGEIFIRLGFCSHQEVASALELQRVLNNDPILDDD